MSAGWKAGQIGAPGILLLVTGSPSHEILQFKQLFHVTKQHCGKSAITNMEYPSTESFSAWSTKQELKRQITQWMCSCSHIHVYSTHPYSKYLKTKTLSIYHEALQIHTGVQSIHFMDGKHGAQKRISEPTADKSKVMLSRSL